MRWKEQRKKFWTVLISFLLALAVTPFIVWTMDNTAPVVYYSIEATNDPAYQGGTLSIKVIGARQIDCPTTIVQSIIDSRGILYQLNERPGMLPHIIGPVEVDGNIPVPENISVGRAIYYSTAQYQCNIMQKLWPLEVDRPEVRFMVLPKPTQP